MSFLYLLALSSISSLFIGRFIISEDDFKYALFKTRLTFILGIVFGLALFATLKHFSWWEVCLQIITIIFGSFIGSILNNTKFGTLIEDYDESIELQSVRLTNLFNKQGYLVIREPYSKRAFDLFISLLGIIILLPIYLIISLLIWLIDPGPFLFTKHSVGKGGKVFKEYKFRTMQIGSALGDIEHKTQDKRLLSIGRLLRRSHIDELPQLFNILRGEMSLVGPRPLRTIDELNDLKSTKGFLQRHTVLPGVAGLAQIKSGYHTDPKSRLKYDLEYIGKRSLLLDIKILFLSVITTLKQTKVKNKKL